MKDQLYLAQEKKIKQLEQRIGQLQFENEHFQDQATLAEERMTKAVETEQQAV